MNASGNTRGYCHGGGHAGTEAALAAPRMGVDGWVTHNLKPSDR